MSINFFKIENEELKSFKKSFGKNKKSDEEICKCFYFILLNLYEITKPNKNVIKKFNKYNTRILNLISKDNDYKIYLWANNNYWVKSLFLIIINHNNNLFDNFNFSILKKIIHYYNVEEKSYFIQNLSNYLNLEAVFVLLLNWLKFSEENINYFNVIKIFIKTKEFYTFFLNHFIDNEFLIKIQNNNFINIIIINLVKELFNPKLKSNKKLLNLYVKQKKLNLKEFFNKILNIDDYLLKRSLLIEVYKVFKNNDYIKSIFLDNFEILILLFKEINNEYYCMKLIIIKLIYLFKKESKNNKILYVLNKNNNNIKMVLNILTRNNKSNEDLKYIIEEF